MYTIKLASGDLLDLPADFNLSFELNNQIFSTSQNDILPGSFSFPATIPLSNRNKKLLGMPHVVNNSKKWSTYDDVVVYCHGAPLFPGTMKITEVNAASAKIYIVSDPIKAIKDMTLAEAFENDYERYLGTDLTAKLIKMKTVARDPDAYDYTFFPVRALEYDDTAPTALAEEFMNFYDGFLESFSNDSAGLVPFVKVFTILEKIFAKANPDFTFVNDWQTNRELQRLYLLNGYDMRVSDGTYSPLLPTNIDLRNHLGETKAADFIKGLMGLFCLGIFTSPFDKRIRLLPLRDVVTKPPKYNWTEYATEGYSITDESAEVPAKFCHPQPDDSPADVPDDVPYTSYSSYQTFASDLATLDPGRYYLEAEELVVEVFVGDSGNESNELGIRRKCVVYDDTPEFETKIGVPFTWDFASQGHYPWVFDVGSYWTLEGDPAEYVRRINTFDPQIVFYRGFQEAAGAVINDRPYASNDVWRPDAAPLPTRAAITTVDTLGAYTDHGDAEYSLLWYSDRGLYAQWWADWHNMLYNGKHVTMQFTLPVSEVIKFDFQDKVRVLQMDYFIKRMRIGKALSHGRVLVECNMVSII